MLCCRYCRCGSRAELVYFDMLQFEYAQQLKLSVQLGVICREYIGRRSLKTRLLDRTLALAIVVLKEVICIPREVGERSKKRAFLVVIIVAL